LWVSIYLNSEHGGYNTYYYIARESDSQFIDYSEGGYPADWSPSWENSPKLKLGEGFEGVMSSLQILTYSETPTDHPENPSHSKLQTKE
jgi:hypothetical protein